MTTYQHPLPVAKIAGQGKREINRLLLVSVGFSLLLLFGRVIYSGKASFLFLGWNLFLGTIPFWISGSLLRKALQTGNRWKLLPGVVVWLLFIPNSFYIITDLFHLHGGQSVPEWFDLLLIFSFAFNALLLGLLSVRHLEKISRQLWPVYPPLLFVFPVMWLCALGVYMGRFLRFNSWDLISHPFTLSREMLSLAYHPVENKSAWAMVLFYAVFLTLIYRILPRAGQVLLQVE